MLKHEYGRIDGQTKLNDKGAQDVYLKSLMDGGRDKAGEANQLLHAANTIPHDLSKTKHFLQCIVTEAQATVAAFESFKITMLRVHVIVSAHTC